MLVYMVVRMPLSSLQSRDNAMMPIGNANLPKSRLLSGSNLTNGIQQHHLFYLRQLSYV
jgi:hypothetical protein